MPTVLLKGLGDILLYTLYGYNKFFNIFESNINLWSLAQEVANIKRSAQKSILGLLDL